MALSDIQIRSARPNAKPYKLFDGGGLHLAVTSAGGKLWRLKYRMAGKEKLLSLGAYPEVGLKEARAKRDEARQLLSKGVDPSLAKQRDKARRTMDLGNTFAAVAREFIDRRKTDGHRPYSPATAAKAEWFLRLLTPSLGHVPVADIQPADILVPLRKLERRGTRETARRCLQFISRVLRYAVATARLSSNPARDLQGALATPVVKHHAAITDPAALGGLLRAIDGYTGQPATVLALRLAPHIFQRPGEVRQMRWEELDLDAAVWIIPAKRMKMREDHAVPLSRQAVALLRESQTMTGQVEGYVFPSLRTRTRPLSENTMNAALRRMGYSGAEMTSHGFRSTASTLLNGSGKWSPDAIERALAHKDKNAVRGIYNRSPYWPERVKMAQWWSDYLDVLRQGAEIVTFPKGKRG